MPFIKRLEKHFTSIDPPEFSREKLPGEFDILDDNDRKIVRFYTRHKLWIFDYADILANGTRLEQLDNDTRNYILGNSGFTIVALLNAYFDLIGQLTGNDRDDGFSKMRNGKETKKSWAIWDTTQSEKDKPSSEQSIHFGLTFVFKAHLKEQRISPTRNKYWRIACETFYKQTRSGIAHVSFPGSTLVFKTTE